MPSMPSLLDVAERSQRGPKMEEKEWDMGLFQKMKELARRYDIVCPPDPPWFNLDDSLPERAFRAAVDFLVEQGVYCISTGRVIQFSEEEVREAIRAQPSHILVGEGRDQRAIEKRPLEYRGEFNLFPGHHAPFSEELAPLVVKNFAQIPEASYIEGFNFAMVDGREIFGMPMEVYAARREAAWMREGVRKAGRPGMAIAYYPINTRAAVLIAPLDPVAGLRRTDGVLLSVLPDIKVEHDLLTAAIVYQEYGAFKVNGGGQGLYGSFAGGYEGAIIEGIVKPIVGWMVYRDEFGYAGINSAIDASPKVVKVDRRMAWAASVVCQALNRYTNYIYFGGYGGGVDGTSGPGSETCLLERAFTAIQSPINGANLSMSRQRRAKMNASQTPLEVEFKVEVSRAVMRAGLTRETAGKLLGGLARLLEGRVVEPPKHITECYDLVNHRPSPEYYDIYMRVKDQLAAMGLEFA